MGVYIVEHLPFCFPLCVYFRTFVDFKFGQQIDTPSGGVCVRVGVRVCVGLGCRVCVHVNMRFLEGPADRAHRRVFSGSHLLPSPCPFTETFACVARRDCPCRRGSRMYVTCKV